MWSTSRGNPLRALRMGNVHMIPESKWVLKQILKNYQIKLLYVHRNENVISNIISTTFIGEDSDKTFQNDILCSVYLNLHQSIKVIISNRRDCLFPSLKTFLQRQICNQIIMGFILNNYINKWCTILQSLWCGYPVLLRWAWWPDVLWRYYGRQHPC